MFFNCVALVCAADVLLTRHIIYTVRYWPTCQDCNLLGKNDILFYTKKWITLCITYVEFRRVDKLKCFNPQRSTKFPLTQKFTKLRGWFVTILNYWHTRATGQKFQPKEEIKNTLKMSVAKAKSDPLIPR